MANKNFSSINDKQVTDMNSQKADAMDCSNTPGGGRSPTVPPGGHEDNPSVTTNAALMDTLSKSGPQAIPPLKDGTAVNKNIATLEPYKAEGWTTINRSRTKRKRRDERVIKQLTTMQELMGEQPYFIKIFNIRFPGININTDLNVIQADNDLKQYVGHPKRVIKAGKSALQIEVRSKAQAENLKKIKKLAGFNVVIESHRTLNQVKGVVRSKAFGQCTEEQLMQSLEDQGVASIRRMKVKRDGQLVNTDTYVLLFNRNERPKVIKLSDWHGEIVEEYREKPQQCYNCQRFNHIAKYCRREVPTCMQCGQEGHKKTECNNDVQCFHCKGRHQANDVKCRKYIIENEIIATIIKEKTTRIDATETVLQRFPTDRQLYAEVTRRGASNAEREQAQGTMATMQQGEERNTIASSDSSKEAEVIRTERPSTSGDKPEKGTEEKIADGNTSQIQVQRATVGEETKKKGEGKKYSFKAREVTEKEIVQSKQGDKRLSTEDRGKTTGKEPNNKTEAKKYNFKVIDTKEKKNQQPRLVESYGSSTESIGDKRDAKKRRANSPDKSETIQEAASAGDNSSAAGHQATKAAAQDGHSKITVIGSGRASGNTSSKRDRQGSGWR